MEEMKSRVYILTDENDNIIRLEGEYSLPDNLDGWTLIEEGEPCDRLNLAQTHFLEKPIINDNGEYNYKYVNGEIVDHRPPEPTPEPSV